MNVFNTATLEQLLNIIDVSGYKLVINDGSIKMLVKEVEN